MVVEHHLAGVPAHRPDVGRGLREHASATLYDLMIGLVENPLLRAVLREPAGNQVRAAQILGINRNTLRKKLHEHGINPGGPEA